jgi:hypothetical protein
MSLTLSVAPRSSRNRVTTLFRPVLAIPLIIIEQAWSALAQICAVVQIVWVLVTGRRNRDLYDVQVQYLGYAARIWTYIGALYDEYPPLGARAGETGVEVAAPYVERSNRWAALFRIVLAIPAIVVTVVLVVAGVVGSLAAWATVVATGRLPEGLCAGLVRIHRYVARTIAYLLLVTDSYPRWS